MISVGPAGDGGCLTPSGGPPGNHFADLPGGHRGHVIGMSRALRGARLICGTRAIRNSTTAQGSDWARSRSSARQPRMIEVRGTAVVIPSRGKMFGERFEDTIICVQPACIISFGIDSGESTNGRSVGAADQRPDRAARATPHSAWIHRLFPVVLFRVSFLHERFPQVNTGVDVLPLAPCAARPWSAGGGQGAGAPCGVGRGPGRGWSGRSGGRPAGLCPQVQPGMLTVVARGQVEDEVAAAVAGDAGAEGDQVPADGRGAGSGVGPAGPGPGRAQQVMGHGGEDEPGSVRVENA